MITILTVTFFVFGLIIGSFLNVIVLRLNTERSFGGRSACMSCQTQLRWFELIPLFSFLSLRGRCRTCQTKISIQYPLVELVTGLVFMFLFLKFQNILFISVPMFTASYGYYAAIFSLLIVIAVYDLKHKIISDNLVLILGVLSFFGIFFFRNFVFYPHVPGVLEFFSGALLATPFALMWLLSRGTWIGLGDSKLIFSLGYLLGLGRALSGVAFSFWSGAIIGIILMLFS